MRNPVPNGGYVTSCFLVVARTHMALTHRNRAAQPHPINLHLEFLRRTSVGPAVFTVKDVKLGARITNLHVVLSQQKTDDDDEWQDEVEGYITVSDIASETGLSLDTEYRPHPPPLPADLGSLGADGHDANYTRRGKDPFAHFRRAVGNIQMYLVQPDRRPRDFPKAMIDQWVRFSPAGTSGRWTNDALGFLVDMFPQIVESYVNPFVEETALGRHSEAELQRYLRQQTDDQPVAKYWYPTLNLNLDVKKLLPADGVEWLFVRVQAKAIREGRLDLNVEVWDPQQELVASSTHASLIVDAARNMTRKPKKSKL
jgi:hypothetical protein